MRKYLIIGALAFAAAPAQAGAGVGACGVLPQLSGLATILFGFLAIALVRWYVKDKRIMRTTSLHIPSIRETIWILASIVVVGLNFFAWDWILGNGCFPEVFLG